MIAEEQPEGFSADDLVDRCRQMAAKARLDPKPERSNPFTVIEGDNLAPAPDDRFAGSDADALFDIGEYGEGRKCAACGDPLEGQRADARFCCDACRVADWRIQQKGPHAHEG